MNSFHQNPLAASVLLVEDDHRLLRAMNMQLTDSGFICTTCDNATEAMIQYAAGRFDLVITDMTMPGIDGLSVLAMIRSQSDVPIIIVTGHYSDFVPWIQSYSRVTVIRKPFEIQALLGHVNESLLGKSVVS